VTAYGSLDPINKKSWAVWGILGSIHIWGERGGSGPALTAHGSFDLKQEIQIQIHYYY
jgi:hypothetical protein